MLLVLKVLVGVVYILYVSRISFRGLEFRVLFEGYFRVFNVDWLVGFSFGFEEGFIILRVSMFGGYGFLGFWGGGINRGRLK